MLTINVIDAKTLDDLATVRSDVALQKGDNVHMASANIMHMITGRVIQTGFSCGANADPTNHLEQFVLVGDVVRTPFKDIVKHKSMKRKKEAFIENAEDIARRWERNAKKEGPNHVIL